MIRSYKILRHASALLSAAAMLWSVSAARADDLPPELRVIVTPDLPADPTQTADNNLLALNSAMFDLYGASGAIFQANFLAKHPVILALFSGAGGHFILYRPGQPPLDAPPVPIVYQLMKSVGHSTMALAEVVMPYIESPKNQAWRASLLAYRQPHAIHPRQCRAGARTSSPGPPRCWRASRRRPVRCWSRASCKGPSQNLCFALVPWGTPVHIRP